jgi:hypothetical protein
MKRSESDIHMISITHPNTHIQSSRQIGLAMTKEPDGGRSRPKDRNLIYA